MRLARAGIFAAAFTVVLSAAPAIAEQSLADPDAEARALNLMTEFGCPVCEGQPISESDAPVAVEMRSLVRMGVARGDTDAEIRDEVAAQYGQSVRLRPGIGGGSWALWLMPLVLLALAGAAGAGILRGAAQRSRNEDGTDA